LVILDDSDYRNAAKSTGKLVSATEALLAAAIARTELAESSLARLTRLRGTQGVSQQDMDNAQTNALTQRELSAAALASVGNYGAQYDLARARADDCVITAPISGTVSAVAFRPGETVLTGSVPVTIVNLDQTWLNVYVPERLLGRVKLGDTCRVRIDGYPKKEFLGTLSFIAEKAEFTPKDIQTKEERINQVYRVKIALPNPEHRLKPGMPADAYLSLH